MPEFDQQAYDSLKALITTKADQVDSLKADLKELSESLQNIFINDSQLSEVEEEQKAVKKRVMQRKKDLATSAEAQSIKARIKETRDELADIQETLSAHLISLYQLTGIQEFEYQDGEVREYKVQAKLKGKGRGKKAYIPENQVDMFTGEVAGEQ